MAFLGKLAAERDLPVQSHLSENGAEMDWVRQLHPDCRQYWETYKKYGLWNDRTVMAHCVWSDERERQAMKDAGVTVVHCADSNQNLCSGVAPVRVMLNEGLKVALGSDIAGGDHLDMFDVVTSAIRASKARRMMDDWQTPFLTVAEGWYLGTSAGAALFRGEARFAAGDPPRHGAGGQRPAPAPAPDPGGAAGTGGVPPSGGGRTGSLVRPEEKSTRSRKKVVRKSLEHKQRSRFREDLPKTAALFCISLRSRRIPLVPLELLHGDGLGIHAPEVEPAPGVPDGTQIGVPQLPGRSHRVGGGIWRSRSPAAGPPRHGDSPYGPSRPLHPAMMDISVS